MKKIISYTFIVIYLFSFSEMKQVMKLPLLVEHYVTHKSHNKNLSIYAFIKMHYLDAPLKDADYKDDMKLPFKTHDCSLVHFTITTPPKSFELSFERKKIFNENIQNFNYSETSTSQKISSVFRPPILA